MRPRMLPFLRSALVAALIAVGALIAIPLGPVPVTLQVLVVAVAALVLSPAEALLALALYLALGAVGMPVFSAGGAGIGVLLGPTGGFLFGFPAGAAAGALARRTLTKSPRGTLVADAAALLLLLAVTYVAGWAWFAVVTGRGAAEAFALAVAPFVVIDAAKCAVALLVARALRASGLADAPVEPLAV